MKDFKEKVQYVYLEKFLKVKEKIIERFKEDSERIDTVEKAIHKLDKKMYYLRFFMLADVIIIIGVLIILGYMFIK